MPEFHAHLITDVTDLTDDEFDALVDELADYAAVPSSPDGRLELTATVPGADDDIVAAARGARLVADRAFSTLGRPGTLTGVEVLTEDEFTRRLDGPPRADDLISTVEAAAVLGVSRQRVRQLSEQRPEFPQPVRLGGRGLYWPRPALVEFKETQQRKPGRPRNYGVRSRDGAIRA